ncbi:transposase [Fimbriiglobus ruber]|uniref:transposase n=1 Tax=Fimbriiglobus ruber TaxID=1908690 RepID=UPI00137A632B
MFKQKVRIVTVETGKNDLTGEPEVLLRATDKLDLEAELVALGYRFRWSVELFFRWFKCILGRRHLLAESQNGLTIQIYTGMIASLLISLWAGKKATKRTYEMFCFYFSEWATEEEPPGSPRKAQAGEEKPWLKASQFQPATFEPNTIAHVPLFSGSPDWLAGRR